jgi:class 3 adenylate cyclase
MIEGNNTCSNEELIPETLNLLSIQSKQNNIDSVRFTEHTEKVCVSIIDIVGSTSIVSTIGSSKEIRKFYEIYLNKISNILRNYQAKIIKTVGDGIISYFPDTVDTSNMRAFQNVIECCFAQIDERFSINSILMEQRLPTIRYRISIDFGKVERARFEGFDSEDLFGSTVNVCSKMNLFAPPNGIILGNDLYRIIKSFKLDNAYMFDEIGSYYCGAGKFSYPLYSLSGMNTRNVVHGNPLTFSLNEIKKYMVNVVKSSRIPKILLIDDELDDLFVLEQFLMLEGFEVKSFSSPREALNHYENGDASLYDLVISDIRMPEINGFELYYKIKAINYNVKVLFATCLEIAEEILTLIPELQPEQLVQKPVEKEKFIKIVKKNIH